MRRTLLPFFALASFGLALPSSGDLTVRIDPFGISEEEAGMWTGVILERREVAQRLAGSRYRVISRNFGALPDKEAAGARAAARAFDLVVYDYTRNQALRIDGSLDAIEQLQIERVRSSESGLPASPEEFAEARELIRSHPEFAGREDEYTAYPGMPAVLDLAEYPRDRVIPVGLMPGPMRAFKHEIVGVNLSRREVIRFPTGAPPASIANERACAPPNAGQAVTGRGTSGQAVIVVERPGQDGAPQEVWRMTAVRPAASSGAFGSMIDLRNVTYRGRKVLSQLHAPILNVLYDFNRCGPYRDWQWEENPFNATGRDFAPGFRQTNEPAQTIFDSGSDRGNFRGVAVYTQGAETVLVTEVSAGWYRYEYKVRLHEDGTISPSVGFAAIQDSCTCNRHHHHAYFRMDFDLGGEKNSLWVDTDQGRAPIASEARFVKGPGARGWAVTDEAGTSGYTITPGPEDGTADAFGRGDAWALAFRRGEIDDSAITGGAPMEIGRFVNGESTQNADVVFWYGGHFTHSTEPEPNSRHNVKVGPVLRPFAVAR